MINPEKLIVLVDMDNTLINLSQKFLEKYNARTNEGVKYEDVTDYHFGNCFKQPHLVDEIICSDGFFLDLDPYPNAIKYFNDIQELDVNLILLTQPSRKSDVAIIEKRKWIQRHLPSFELSNVIFTHHKELVDGDIFFDDSPEHLKNWENYRYEYSCRSFYTCKIEHPYNKNTRTDFSFMDIDTAWERFYEVVRNTLHNYSQV